MSEKKEHINRDKIREAQIRGLKELMKSVMYMHMNSEQRAVIRKAVRELKGK